MTTTAFWLFLLLATITDSQHISTMPSRIPGPDDGGDNGTEGGQELDLAQSIFKQLKVHLSAPDLPDQIRRLASGEGTTQENDLDSKEPTASLERTDDYEDEGEEGHPRSDSTLKPIEEVLAEVVQMVIIQIIAERKKQGADVTPMSKEDLKELIKGAVQDKASRAMPSAEELSSKEIEKLVLTKMVEMVVDRESMVRFKVNPINDGGGKWNDDPGDGTPSIKPALNKPYERNQTGEVPMKNMMTAVAKTLAKEAISVKVNHSKLKMSEEEAELLMMKALTRASINHKTEELEPGP